MDAFLAKKTGEILAFSKLTEETFKKAKETLAGSIKESDLDEIIGKSASQIGKIEDVSEKNGVLEAVRTKAEKTVEKIGKMRDLYLKEEDWEDPAEVFEWLGFFEGAAVVHFSLVLGKAREAGVGELVEIAVLGFNFHQELLETVSLAIRKV